MKSHYFVIVDSSQETFYYDSLEAALNFMHVLESEGFSVTIEIEVECV